MKKKIIFILLMLIMLFPFNASALSKNYKDEIADITNTKVEKNKINIYLFHGYSCPHCKKERKWLKTIKEDYRDYVNIYYFEVWKNDDNARLMDKVKDKLGVTKEGVPLTIIGDEYFVGYSDAIASKMENEIKRYAGLKNNPNGVNVPILGNVNMKKVSIPLVAVILGFIDGFNPCAMWILLFLINMLIGIKDKKKSWIIGFTFLFVSGLVYFLSMIGINLAVSAITINWIKILIALFILIFGIINLRKYFKMRKEEAGCSVVDSKKRKKINSSIHKILESKSFLFALLGTSVLAASVNLVELACSLGFPLVFTEILSINKVTGLLRIIYLLIYIFFYMIDDIVVFVISMKTLEATGVTNKYNKLCTLISSIIMIIMGILLIFKPEWLMLNF